MLAEQIMEAIPGESTESREEDSTKCGEWVIVSLMYGKFLQNLLKILQLLVGTVHVHPEAGTGT